MTMRGVNKQHMIKKINSGFTLIEVLIALTVLAIALTAVIKATEDNSRNALTLQNRIVSQWVAMNIFADLQSGVTAIPETGSHEQGQTLMLNHTWYWDITTATISNQIAQIAVSVSVEKSQPPLLQWTGFVMVKKS